MKIEKKVRQEYFQMIMDGRKKFELRLADWEINEGDILILREWDPEQKNYTGRMIEKEVTCIIKTKDINFFTEDEIEKFGYQVIGF
jgi:ASC-1-like (ASCH) protein